MKYIETTTLIKILTAVAVLSTTLLLSNNVYAEKSFARFNSKGQLIRPTAYREWIFIGAPVTPNDMNNGKAAFPEFHNVYIDPVGWKHWKNTGHFKQGTIIVKELVSIGGKQSSSGNGYFMGEYQGLEAVVKDKTRFPSADNHWGFFRFTTDDHKTLLRSSQSMKSDACAACHSANANQDSIFTQHYPVLRAAKAKGEAGTGGR